MDSLVKSTSVATVKGVVVMGVPVGLIPRRIMSPLGAPPGWYFQVMSSPAALVQTVEAVGEVK